MNGDYAFPDLSAVAEHFTEKEFFRNTSFLVTGATGLIGSVLVKSLLYLNDSFGMNIRVTVHVRDREKASAVYGALLDRDDIDLVVQNITEGIEYPGNVDFVVHTASPTASRYFVTKPVETIAAAYEGTKAALDFCVEKRVKGLVYLSSMEAFGIPDPALPEITEKDLGYIDLSSVRSSYSEGKRICELLCAAYAAEYGAPVKIARLAQTFGAAVNISENRVFAQFARSILDETDIILHTEGKSDGNYCCTSDVVNALFLLLSRGADGEVYTVCNETANRTIAEMAQMVAETFGGGKVRVVFDIPDDGRTYGYAPTVKMKLSSKKLRALGWVPYAGLTEMYERLIASFKMQRGSACP